MAVHKLDASVDTVHWGYFDAALKPLVTIDSGDTVTVSTVSGMPNQLPKDKAFAVPPALTAIHQKVQQRLGGPHILTGPVAVRGAKAGQVLEVRIKSIDLHYNWGYNAIRPIVLAFKSQAFRLRTPEWQRIFTIICDDASMQQAVTELGFPAADRTRWIEGEQGWW